MFSGRVVVACSDRIADGMKVNRPTVCDCLIVDVLSLIEWEVCCLKDLSMWIPFLHIISVERVSDDKVQWSNVLRP